jgi:hypothetical protein
MASQSSRAAASIGNGKPEIAHLRIKLFDPGFFRPEGRGFRGRRTPDKGAVAAVTQMENDSVKADTAGDPSYVEKNYADNFSGGSSWGNWETKQSILADMKDNKNNKTNSEVISDLNVRIYGDTAIVTYTSTYDSVYHGEHRARTILSTDIGFARLVCAAARCLWLTILLAKPTVVAERSFPSAPSDLLS